jgi:LEA14-like dessication related protein
VDDDDPVIPEPVPIVKDLKEDEPVKEKITGTLKFTRENRYAGMLISMSVYIDDIMVGKVGNDQSVNFSLPAGQHYLQVKGGLAFSTSRELFVVKQGETEHWISEFTLWNGIKLKHV